MRRHHLLLIVVVIAIALVVMAGRLLVAQSPAPVPVPASRSAYAAATAARELRIVVSIANRRLWVVSDSADTVFSAPVAVGSGKVLAAGGQRWHFVTPLGVHTIRSKEENPLWVRPDWAYIEAARAKHLRLDSVSAGRPRPLGHGRMLVVRGNIVGVSSDSSNFEPTEYDSEIVFGGVLYMPPIGAVQRGVAGTLGNYRLNLGDGIGLHGTSDHRSIGHAATHGCMRLDDLPLEWIYYNIPVGAKVYIY